MALTNGPNLGLLINGAPAEEHYDALMQQWRGLDALVQPRVQSVLSTPPVSPADGVTYIIGEDADGAWAGQDGKIARFAAVLNSWEVYSVKRGWEAFNLATNSKFRFNGTTWAAVGAASAGTEIQIVFLESGDSYDSDGAQIFTHSIIAHDGLTQPNLMVYDVGDALFQAGTAGTYLLEVTTTFKGTFASSINIEYGTGFTTADANIRPFHSEYSSFHWRPPRLGGDTGSPDTVSCTDTYVFSADVTNAEFGLSVRLGQYGNTANTFTYSMIAKFTKLGPPSPAP